MSATRRKGPFVALADMTDQTGYMLSTAARALLVGLFPRPFGRGVARLFQQLYVQLVKSLGVVTVVGVFTGMILALQTGETLQNYGLEDRLGSLIGATMAREMGPFITSIILAATVGASIAAELGTMRVSQEIDALELMNIDPVPFLVSPRIQALGLSAVLLTVWVDVIGVIGGAVVAHSQYGVSYADTLEGARTTFASEMLYGSLSKDIFSGLTKALVFGLFVGALSCAAGLRAHGGALGVGRAVRSAVIGSVLVTLIIGYLVTWMFWA